MTRPIPMLKSGATSALLAREWANLQRVQATHRGTTPRLVLVLPPTWNNRYQSLLYSEAGPRGYAVMGIGDDSVLRDVAWPGELVIHAHWFASLFDACQDEGDAAERLTTLQGNFADFQDRTGARFVWTAHNVFPHGNRFPDTYMALRRWIFESFDAVHVMHDDHVGVLRDAYGMEPPSHFVVPHMTYAGAQPDCVSTVAAKSYFGIDPDAFVFACFGSIQPYKNLELMLTAFEQIADEGHKVTAIIGGVPSDSATVQRLRSRWGSDQRVHLVMRMVPDHEIQHFHRAADAIVLPYEETLNSGAAHMAATFSKPIVLPAGSAARAVDGLGALTYDATAADGLVNAMRAAIDGVRGTIDPIAWGQIAPPVVSNKFFDQVDALVDRDGPGPQPLRGGSLDRGIHQ